MTDSTNIAELFASAWTRHLISRFRFAFASLAFAAASTLAAAEFRGRLNPEVQPGTRSGGYLQKATADAVALLPELPPPTATVWAPRQPVRIKGATYATLPASCGYRFVNGGAYYLCGNAWLAPQYGNNGLHYVVVPAP